MDFPRFLLSPASTRSFKLPRAPLRRHFCSALILGAAFFPATGARAQNAAPATAPATAPLPSAPGIGILLLALDELPAPGAALKPPGPPAITPALPGAIVPDAPTGAITPAAITPAAITPARAPWNLAPLWLASAQKKPKVDKDADLFRLEPDFSRRGGAPVVPPQNPIQTPPAAPFAVVPLAPLQNLALPGRAGATALPLRRALLSLGWSNVSLVTPGSGLLNDALVERRLTPRTLESLKNALADIAAPGTIPTPDATARATRAAARIGQALGYRAVAALYVAPSILEPGAAPNGPQSAAFSVFLADSARENGEPILFDERGAGESALREAGASTAAALLDRTLRTWPAVTASERLELAAKHLQSAKTQLAAGDSAGAEDELAQSIALDTTKAEPLVLLGDLLAVRDPIGAANLYRRAVEIDARDGATLAKIAVTYASATVPDWPRALDAGRRAIASGFDSVPLRVAMATAQYGRADLFRRADRLDKAEAAESEARDFLDRALELAPDDPSAVRLLARRLVETRRFNEATQTLDRVAPRYPNDVEIQTQYAAALAGQIGREEDAFVASSRVWRLSGQRRVDIDAIAYRRLTAGFDARLFNIGKNAVRLTSGVASAALPREEALIQLIKIKEDMTDAENAIIVLRAPVIVGLDTIAARQFAASLMTQSLEQQQLYLETGQSLARLRGKQLYDQAVAQLNAARGGR